MTNLILVISKGLFDFFIKYVFMDKYQYKVLNIIDENNYES